LGPFSIAVAARKFSRAASELARELFTQAVSDISSLIQLDMSNREAASANLQRYNYRPDSDSYVIYNVGTQFASLALANPPQVRETRFAVKWTYSFAPRRGAVTQRSGLFLGELPHFLAPDIQQDDTN
jgi:hypothetical protein